MTISAANYSQRWKLARFGAMLGLLVWAEQATAQDTTAAQQNAKLFTQQCGTCHSVTPGEVRVGPSLAGILGRAAGKQAGFAYSDSLKRSRLKWNAATLDRWLTDTNTTIPGNYMNYHQADAAKRQAIITYIASTKSK